MHGVFYFLVFEGLIAVTRSGLTRKIYAFVNRYDKTSDAVSKGRRYQNACLETINARQCHQIFLLACLVPQTTKLLYNFYHRKSKH